MDIFVWCVLIFDFFIIVEGMWRIGSCDGLVIGCEGIWVVDCIRDVLNMDIDL